MQQVKVEGIAGYITVEQAAKILKMTNDGVVKIVHRNNVPCLRLGRSLLVKPSDLKTYSGRS